MSENRLFPVPLAKLHWFYFGPLPDPFPAKQGKQGRGAAFIIIFLIA